MSTKYLEKHQMNLARISYQQDKLFEFLRDQKFTDCIFKIDGEEIRAHKLILACSSPVFEKMFFGDLASSDICLEDIKLQEFNQMLEYIYMENIKFSSILNAWSMFYVSKKYILDSLANKCLKFISDNLTVSTLLLSYEYSELYNLDMLRNKCLHDITEGFSAVFVSDYHMKPSTMRTLLKKDLLITKVDLLCKILEWTSTECEFRGFQVAPERIVQILKEEEILQYISKKWLLEMKCEYCDCGLVACECVDEMLRNTFRYLSGVDWIEEPTLDRFNQISSLCNTKKVYKIARRIDLQEYEEFVSAVNVSAEVVVAGILLSTEMNNSDGFSSEYKGCVAVRFCEFCCADKTINKPTILNRIFSYNSHVFVPLRYAVVLRPDRLYDIRISYKNYSTGKKSSVVCSYMSSELESGSTKLIFFDFQGTIIKGIAYYTA